MISFWVYSHKTTKMESSATSDKSMKACTLSTMNEAKGHGQGIQVN